MNRVHAWLSTLWCDWTHGGGRIERDHLGRINWRCAKCGRWSDSPVSRVDEDATVLRDLEAYRQRRKS